MYVLTHPAIATVGGELFVEIGLQLKRRAVVSHPMVFGLTDGNLWYIPHRDAYQYGGYGVDTGPSGPLGDDRVEERAGLGEKLLDAWLEMMMYEQGEATR